jgi:hypothetical protein
MFYLVLKVLEIYLSFLISFVCIVLCYSLPKCQGYNKVLYHASSTSYIMHPKQFCCCPSPLPTERTPWAGVLFINASRRCSKYIQSRTCMYMSLYAFHLGQVISTVLGYNDHGGQHDICAETWIRGESPENDPALKQQCRHSSNFQKGKAITFLKCL